MKNIYSMKHIAMKMMLLLPFIFHFSPSLAEHLFEAGLRAGMSSYAAQCRYVSPAPSVHAGIQLSYAFHSSHVIGFRFAATLDRHQAGFRQANYTDTYSVIDVENAPMQVDYSIGLLSETYTTWSVGIPLQLALTKNHFALYLGPKIVFPFRSRWTEKAEKAALSVYYPEQDNRVYNSYPLAASPSFQETQNGTTQLPPVQYWIAAEISYDIPVHTGLRTKSYISVGLYFDYSLSAVTADPSDRISLLMLSDTRDGFPLHRIMTPVVSAYRQGRRLVTSRNPFDFGVKIAYRFAPYNPRRQAYKMCHCND